VNIANQIECPKKTTMYDKFPVKNGDILVINIEKIDSKYRQGLTVDIAGKCEINGEMIKKGKGIRIILWEDTFKEMNPIKIFTKKDFVRIYNICEIPTPYLVSDENGNPLQRWSKCMEYGHNCASMAIEEIEDGRRYVCSDVVNDGNVGNIVFTVKKIQQPEAI
jgi:hypothetical protein